MVHAGSESTSETRVHKQSCAQFCTWEGSADGNEIDRSPGVALPEAIHVGVVIPVHNEEQRLLPALESVGRAIDSCVEGRCSKAIAVVLDRCTDRSSHIASDWRHRVLRANRDRHIEIIEIDAGNVGSARREGCRALLHRWTDDPMERIWLATTDADSQVPANWLSEQLHVRREGGQVWIGAVSVRNWSDRTPGTAEAWLRQYEDEALPIHGANFGIDAATYLEAGGFEDLPTGEDRNLFEKAVALGASIRHDPSVRVVTSSRREARAPRGFAHALTVVEAAVSNHSMANPAEVAVS